MGWARGHYRLGPSRDTLPIIRIEVCAHCLTIVAVIRVRADIPRPDDHLIHADRQSNLDATRVITQSRLLDLDVIDDGRR